MSTSCPHPNHPSWPRCTRAFGGVRWCWPSAHSIAGNSNRGRRNKDACPLEPRDAGLVLPNQFREDRFQGVGPELVTSDGWMELVGVLHSIEQLAVMIR